jgi:hypothetical protein
MVMKSLLLSAGNFPFALARRANRDSRPTTLARAFPRSREHIPPTVEALTT